MLVLINFVILTIVCDGVFSHEQYYWTWNSPSYSYSNFNKYFPKYPVKTPHFYHHHHHHTPDCNHPQYPSYPPYLSHYGEDYEDFDDKPGTKTTTKAPQVTTPETRVVTSVTTQSTSTEPSITTVSTEQPEETTDPFSIDIRYSSDSENSTKTVTKRSTKDIEQITKPSFPLNSLNPFNFWGGFRSQPFHQDSLAVCNEKKYECVPIYKCKSDKAVNSRRFCRHGRNSPFVCCEKPVNKIAQRLDSDCGRRKSSGKSAAIIGGGNVENGSNYPWMAVIGQFEKNGDIDWFCGGALVSPQTIVTAAHCLGRRSADIVRIGETDITKEDSETLQEILVWRRFIHPLYRPPLMYQDIALVYLHDPVEITKFVKPICLPRKPVQNGVALLTGWGQLSFDTEKSDILQKVSLQLFNNSVCDKSYANNIAAKRNFPRGILDTQICAGDEEGGKDACQGDSGSPLVTEEDGNFVLTGVVSAGIGCGSKLYPGIYTRVSSYVPWIIENMI